MDRNSSGRTGTVPRVGRQSDQPRHGQSGAPQGDLINNLSFLNDRRRLERILGERRKDLQQIAGAASEYYRERHLWTKGKSRRLLVPNLRLKLIQIRLFRNALRMLEAHPAAYAVRGRGTIRAAQRHLGNRWFYHRDIKDFYPSVRTAFVRERFTNLGVEQETADLLARLVTVEDELPQGAPTSPSIGNLALWRLDYRIAGLTADVGLVYTRYMDDITVSGGQHLEERFASRIDEIIADCGWELNSKGGLVGPRERHRMLGVNVNERLGVPRAKYDLVRQKLKLAERGQISLTDSERESIRGTINWIVGVNPSQGAKLQERFARL
jgi:RNA-directed DNA polymerase